MPTFQEYWDEAHIQLADNFSYLNEAGQRQDFLCQFIALDLGRLLMADGSGLPYTTYMYGAGTNRHSSEALEPLLYEGRVSWRNHIVCQLADVIYDPILPKPEPIKTYPLKMFGKDIRISNSYPFSPVPTDLNYMYWDILQINAARVGRPVLR